LTAISSSWLVGSLTLTDAATIVVGGNNAAVAAGTYYLRDASPSLSLIDTIQTAIAAHYAGSTVRVQRDRKVRIDLNGASASLTIPAALQAALGFTGSPYGSATGRTAEAVSTLLWSPGWPETPIGHPVGSSGVEIPNWVQTSSPSGLTTRTTTHGVSARVTELQWQQVLQARVWTTSDGQPGEFRRFHREVLTPGRRWKLYSGITEDDSSTTAVTWTTALGPYVLRDPDWRWFNRSISNTDRRSSITLKGTLVSEVS
jgi:hypothetical protein